MPSLDAKELARLQELADLDLGGEVEDPRVQALVTRAAQELELPIAAVSIILDSAQYFVASHGLGGWLETTQGTPGEWAFCHHAITRREPFIVEQADQDPLVSENPLVSIDKVRCYLGVPLITSRDQAIGTLCVLGVEGRSFSLAEVGRMVDLADEVLPLLESRRKT